MIYDMADLMEVYVEYIKSMQVDKGVEYVCEGCSMLMNVGW